MNPAEPRRIFTGHQRDWRDNRYIYPVISRRSKGLSIGINLNPDKACNFDCIYCQVDRSIPPTTRRVELEVLSRELHDMLHLACSGALFDDPRFALVPPSLRRINDLAFSGDGEPTTCPQFLEAVRLAAELKHAHRLEDVKLILITDACYLTRPVVVEALQVMDDNNGEIWAKLDAGTEAYYQRVNRPNLPLSRVIDNIRHAARDRAVVIQSLFMRIEGAPPPPEEIEAFCEVLCDIRASGGRIKLVQVYTVARQPAEAVVTPLSNPQVDDICRTVSQPTGIPAEAYYAAADE